jgi:hypothetical protein
MIRATSIMSRIYNSTNGTMKVTVRIDGRPYFPNLSGADINGHGGGASQISDWLWFSFAQQPAQWNTWGNFWSFTEVGIVSMVSGVFNVFRSVSPDETIRVILKDGTTTDFKFNFWNTLSGDDIQPIINSSRDGSGNLIPFTASALSGSTYYFGGPNATTDMQRWVMLLSGFGYRVIGGTVTVGTTYFCSDTSMSCSPQ